MLRWLAMLALKSKTFRRALCEQWAEEVVRTISRDVMPLVGPLAAAITGAVAEVEKAVGPGPAAVPPRGGRPRSV